MENLFGEVSTQETETTSHDETTLKESLKKYSNERQNSSIILESHKRATFLIDHETLRQFNNLIAHQEALNSIGSSFHSSNSSARDINRSRAMTKGLKSKIVNYAISSFLDQWEAEEGLIPETTHIKFKVSGVYHRLYMFEIDGVTYLVENDNRGHETHFLSTEQNTIEEINEWYEKRLEQIK